MTEKNPNWIIYRGDLLDQATGIVVRKAAPEDLEAYPPFGEAPKADQEPSP